MRSMFAALAAATLLAAPAFAQSAPLRVDINAGLMQPMPIAVPAFAPGNGASTEAGTTTQIGERAAQVIANDLKSSGLFRPLDPAAYTTTVGIDDVLKPDFPAWRTIAAQALVTGTVTANPDGGITLACYAYDVFAGAEIARQGFVTTAAGWRRAAHKCADLVYSRLTGESGYFDSRIVYVSETGTRTKRIKRLAIMDQDGAGHRFLTSGQNLVLTPRFAPGQQTITYMSFENNRPRVWIYTLGSGRQEAVGQFIEAFVAQVGPAQHQQRRHYPRQEVTQQQSRRQNDQHLVDERAARNAGNDGQFTVRRETSHVARRDCRVVDHYTGGLGPRLAGGGADVVERSGCHLGNGGDVVQQGRKARGHVTGPGRKRCVMIRCRPAPCRRSPAVGPWRHASAAGWQQA